MSSHALSQSALDELFNRDPEQLTKSDRTAMIAHYRASRAAFKEAEASGKNKRKPKAPQMEIDLSTLKF